MAMAVVTTREEVVERTQSVDECPDCLADNLSWLLTQAQGGTFAPGPSADLVRCMREWGVPGVGQSSWGPAVYGILEGAIHRLHHLLLAFGMSYGDSHIPGSLALSRDRQPP